MNLWQRLNANTREQLLSDLSWVLNVLIPAVKSRQTQNLPPTTKVMPQPAQSTAPTNPDALLPDWSIIPAAHHNVRALCDLEGLSYDQKETLAACVMIESGFHIDAIHRNTNAAGKVFSTDYGICQWNDVYHGSEITPDEALHNPEKAVRLMCRYFKAGKQGQWVSFSSGAYLKFKGRV